MHQPLQQSARLSLMMVGVISALLYLSGFGSVFFLIPYAWLLTVYTVRELPLAIGVQGAAIVVSRLAQSIALFAVFIELLVIASLLLALICLYAPPHPRLRAWRGIYRLLLVAALFMAVTLPAMYMRTQDPDLVITLAGALDAVLQQSTSKIADPNQLVAYALRILCGTYVGFYILIPIMSWWLAQSCRLLSPRLFRNATGAHYPVEQFRLPHNSIWPFIGCFVALLLLLNNAQSLLFFVLTNILTVLGLLYIMQGVALIMRFGMRRYSRVQIVRIGLIIAACALFLPIVNGIIVMLLFVVGISETWAHYDTKVFHTK